MPTNKYAEGYPAKRYYGGCEYVDIVENIAIDRAKALFAARHANVQPHSGSQANMGVYFATIKPGDTILGMDLSPFETLSPFVTSGIRINVQVLTSRGMKTDEMRQIAGHIDQALSSQAGESKIEASREAVRALSRAFPDFLDDM